MTSQPRRELVQLVQTGKGGRK